MSPVDKEDGRLQTLSCPFQDCLVSESQSSLPHSGPRIGSYGVLILQCIVVNLQQFVFKEYGGLTGYSLVLVHYLGTGKLLRIKCLADTAVVD